MTTTPTPAQRLDAICEELAYRISQPATFATDALRPLLVVAQIVRDLHRDAQRPQGAPEPAPEGDGTTDPGSGRETGAQRGDHGWHTMPPGSFLCDGEDRSDRYQYRHDGAPAGARRPGHALTPAVEQHCKVPDGFARISCPDLTVDYPRDAGLLVEPGSGSYFRLVHDVRPADDPSRMPAEQETGAQDHCPNGARKDASAITDCIIDDLDLLTFHGGFLHIHGARITRATVEPTPDEIDRLRASLSEAEDTIARLRKERDAHAERALAFRAERVEIEGELAGAQRFKVGDRVQVRDFGPHQDGVVDDVDDTGGAHVIRCTDGVGMWVPTRLLRHRAEPTPDWYRSTVEEFIARRDEYVRVLKQCVETDADYWRWQGHAAARRQLAESLKTARPADDPTPGPVVLPTTPGSVAWTRDGGRYVLTGDADSQPWFGPGQYVSADELLTLGVVGAFDAGAVA